MKNSIFQEKSLVNYQGMVLCDNYGFPKVYNGFRKANETAIKLDAKVRQIVSTKEKYYVVK